MVKLLLMKVYCRVITDGNYKSRQQFQEQNTPAVLTIFITDVNYFRIAYLRKNLTIKVLPIHEIKIPRLYPTILHQNETDLSIFLKVQKAMSST